ncbi:dTMP kinase [Kordiimonas pumila]|uniref:Thymidylate kinase n=1 Tax=Kordiimonas pumila TaxID=2161677 RepID=A0ABV7D227_9PROT|nr:dTMP kinase [Kordiimonas pumila]
MADNKPLKAKFISLEGGEGAGKSTQIRLLADWLSSQGIPSICTREPGGSDGAELIRDLLVKGAVDRWTPITEALLMTAARTEHIARTIKPALATDKWVLCDRFFDSSIAYQGAGRALGTRYIKDMQTLAFDAFKPDLTLILDLPVKIGLARAKSRENAKTDSEDRFERLDLSFHETLRAAYLAIASDEPERCKVVKADQTVDSIQTTIRQIVKQKFNLPND